jgi:hypothetical protein
MDKLDKPGDTGLIYADRLVRMSDDRITFLRYYFPVLASKQVAYANIDHIDVEPPALTNGKWRIWGSGDLTTWFPLDTGRPFRDRIFIATLNNQRTKIGFTVEDSAKVIRAFRRKGVIITEH